jgi:hypothetical protein
VSEQARHFDEELLDRLTSTVTRHVGQAAACVAVAKAAEEADDLYKLCMAVAAHVPGEKRAGVLRDMADFVEPAALTSETLSAAAKTLAQHIGPLAQVLVDRESRNARNRADLYWKLARHVRDPDARKAFLSAAFR